MDQAFLLRKELALIDKVPPSQAQDLLHELHQIYQRENLLTTDLETQSRYLSHRRGDALAWHERFMALFNAIEEGLPWLSSWPSLPASQQTALPFGLGAEEAAFLEKAGQAPLVQQLHQAAQRAAAADARRTQAFADCARYLQQYTVIAQGYPTEVRESSRLSVWTKLLDDVLENMSPKTCEAALSEAFRPDVDAALYSRARAREEQLAASLLAAQEAVSALESAEAGSEESTVLAQLQEKQHDLRRDLRLLAQTATSVANDPQIFEPFECAMLPILDEVRGQLQRHEAALAMDVSPASTAGKVAAYVDLCVQFRNVVGLLREAYGYHGARRGREGPASPLFLLLSRSRSFWGWRLLVAGVLLFSFFQILFSFPVPAARAA